MILAGCHIPPGTSKWIKIEHRVVCHISRNWRNIPLETLEVVVASIGSTRTVQGLDIHIWLEESTHHKGRKLTNAEMAKRQIKRAKLHGECTCEIHPRRAR